MQKTNLNKTLKDLAVLYTQKLEQRARLDKTNATGKFIKSFDSIVTDDSIEIFSNSNYAGAVDGGAGPSTSTSGGYDKKQRLIQWAKAKGIRPVRKLKGGYKFAKMKTDNNSAFNSMIFAIAKSIAKKGTIKRFQYNGSQIFERVFEEVKKKAGLDIKDAFSADLRKELKIIVKQK